MDDGLLALLREVQAGALAPEEALGDPRLDKESDLGFAVLDRHRTRRGHF